MAKSDVIPIPENEFENFVFETRKMEKELTARSVALDEKYPEVFAEMEAISKAAREVDARKGRIKSYLVEHRDFDVHEDKNGLTPGLRYSVTRVASVRVADMEKVPEEYKRVEVVADETRAIEYLRTMDEPPAGFIDTSYYRLNWRGKPGNNEKQPRKANKS